MTDKTKQMAINKLDKIVFDIGHCGNLRTYDIKLTSNPLYNAMKLNITNYIHDIYNDKCDMHSYIVNACYSPTKNNISIPLAMISLIDIQKNETYNYANIGCVISHEITHAFDDQGAKYDETGTLHDWWQPNDKIEYNKKIALIKEVYNDVNIDGSLTVGENIADFGALIISLHALILATGKMTKHKFVDFVRAYGNLWRYQIRPEYQQIVKKTDPHSLARYRVNLPIKHQAQTRNILIKKFGMSNNNKMYSDKIVKIW